MVEIAGSPAATEVIRDTEEPTNPPDGALWINPSGGQSGNNVERYQWDPSASSWDLLLSIGPDSPTNVSAGAIWQDTGQGVRKSRAGGTWHRVDITSHTDLSDTGENAHHNKSHDHTEGDISDVPESGLGFNTATQNDLDNHEGNNDAHHTQTTINGQSGNVSEYTTVSEGSWDFTTIGYVGWYLYNDGGVIKLQTNNQDYQTTVHDGSTAYKYHVFLQPNSSYGVLDYEVVRWDI